MFLFGHKVNASKSQLFFFPNTCSSIKEEIGKLSGFQITDDLGIYLGMPLLHARAKKSTFHFIVEKMQRKLNTYDAKLLSLAGRVTLAKSVLLSISGFFMQTVMLPVGVCEQIEQLVRHLIWGFSALGPKVSLVRWDACCQSFPTGGLGLRRMVTQNVSYLMKLAFSFMTKVDALWVRVLCSKYKVMEVVPETIDRTSCSFVWRSLARIWSKFRDRIKLSVGNGHLVRFAGDDWVPSIVPLYPHLIPGMSLSSDTRVVEFVDSSGNWNWQLLQ